MEFSVCIAIHVQKYLYEKAVFYLVRQDLSCQVKLHTNNW